MSIEHPLSNYVTFGFRRTQISADIESDSCVVSPQITLTHRRAIGANAGREIVRTGDQRLEEILSLADCREHMRK